MEELWKDLNHNKYFKFNETTGCKSPCNKFGQSPTAFNPYLSGFPKSLSSRIIRPDSNYKIQPKKFDGYFQCPRPAGETQYKTFTRLKDDIKSLPKPVKFLCFSSIYDKNNPPPIEKKKKHALTVKSSFKTLTIDDLKKEIEGVQVGEVKTARDMIEDLERFKKSNKSFTAKVPKPKRRNLKGYFMIDVPSGNELFSKEKQMMKVTNPVGHFKQAKWEELDRKHFEKRKKQKELNDRLIMLQSK